MRNSYDRFLEASENEEGNTESLQDLLRTHFSRDYYKANYFLKVLESELESITLGIGKVSLKEAKKYKKANKKKFI